MKTKTQRTAKPGARSHPEKGQNKFDSGGAACSEPAEAQLAVVVGKPACWWLLPRLTISTVEKAQRAFFVGGHVGRQSAVEKAQRAFVGG